MGCTVRDGVGLVHANAVAQPQCSVNAECGALQVHRLGKRAGGDARHICMLYSIYQALPCPVCMLYSVLSHTVWCCARIATRSRDATA